MICSKADDKRCTCKNSSNNPIMEIGNGFFYFAKLNFYVAQSGLHIGYSCSHWASVDLVQDFFESIFTEKKSRITSAVPSTFPCSGWRPLSAPRRILLCPVCHILYKVKVLKCGVQPLDNLPHGMVVQQKRIVAMVWGRKSAHRRRNFSHHIDYGKHMD